MVVVGRGEGGGPGHLVGSHRSGGGNLGLMGCLGVGGF